MTFKKPLSKENYLCSIYSTELEYINQIMRFQDYHFINNGEIVLLLDRDFPGFEFLNEKKIEEIISIYENVGWKIRKETVKDRAEFLIVLS